MPALLVELVNHEVSEIGEVFHFREMRPTVCCTVCNTVMGIDGHAL